MSGLGRPASPRAAAVVAVMVLAVAGGLGAPPEARAAQGDGPGDRGAGQATGGGAGRDEAGLVGSASLGYVGLNGPLGLSLDRYQDDAVSFDVGLAYRVSRFEFGFTVGQQGAGSFVSSVSGRRVSFGGQAFVTGDLRWALWRSSSERTTLGLGVGWLGQRFSLPARAEVALDADVPVAELPAFASGFALSVEMTQSVQVAQGVEVLGGVRMLVGAADIPVKGETYPFGYLGASARLGVVLTL